MPCCRVVIGLLRIDYDQMCDAMSRHLDIELAPLRLGNVVKRHLRSVDRHCKIGISEKARADHLACLIRRHLHWLRIDRNDLGAMAIDAGLDRDPIDSEWLGDAATHLERDRSAVAPGPYAIGLPKPERGVAPLAVAAIGGARPEVRQLRGRR